jgi:methyltransferase-like protein 6
MHVRESNDAVRVQLYAMAPTTCTTNTILVHGATRCYQPVNASFARRRQRRQDHGDGESRGKSKSAVVGYQLDESTKLALQEQVAARERDGRGVSRFWRDQYSAMHETAKNWDQFYTRHRTHFFKDRHYMEDEYPDLENARVGGERRTLLEAGCGVGNTVLPLLDSLPSVHFFATDFSPKAIQLLNATQVGPTAKERLHAFVSDMSSENAMEVWQRHILSSEPDGVDIVMMIFSLSAVPPERHAQAMDNISKVMKVGGRLLFRDYARCDHTQLKFSTNNRLEENFYVRQDGTLTYFFDQGALVELFEMHGFKAIESKHIERVIENRSTKETMRRIWIQATFEYVGPQ